MIESESAPDFRRLHLLFLCVVLLFGAISVRLWYLQVVKNEEFLIAADKQRTRLLRRLAPRGEIVDAKERVIATSRPNFVISVVPDEIVKYPGVLDRLTQLLHLDPDKVADQMEVGKKTPSDPVPVLEDADIATLSIVEESLLDLPGVFIGTAPKRYYEDKTICSHVLGVVSPISREKLDKLVEKGYRPGDYIGTMGVEASYEKELRGVDGGQYVEVDVKGRMKRALDERKPTPGHTLQLTIDMDLQKVANDALQEQLALGRTGAVVALDPNDGAVLALATTPTFDANRFREDYNKLNSDPLSPLYSRATQTARSCGSPFKLITAMAGLETRNLTTGSGDYCPGFIKLGNRVFRCDKRSGHGHIDFYTAIAASCDVFFYNAGMKVGIDDLAIWAKRFGLGSKTGIDLLSKFESSGVVPTPQWKKKRFKKNPWVGGDVVNLAIGQGYLTATPLQLAVFVSALANGGEVLAPQLVREIRDVSNEKPIVTHRLEKKVRMSVGMKPENRNAVVEGMRRVVQEHGTAAGIVIPGLTVAGKTGTAERIEKHNMVNDSFFVCFAPIDKPKIAIVVMVERGGMGAATAAPIARRLLMQYFNIATGQASVPVVRRGSGSQRRIVPNSGATEKPKPVQSTTPSEPDTAPVPNNEDTNSEKEPMPVDPPTVGENDN